MLANSGLPLFASVPALAIDPHEPMTVYAGITGNEIQKSTDAGTHWTALNSGLTHHFVQALALAPGGRTLYVGTGSGVSDFQFVREAVDNP